MAQDSVKSLMNPRVISVLPETTVLAAIDIILTSNFNGIPVSDKNGILVGIVTKYDLIANRNSLRDDTKVSAVMNTDPLVLDENASIEDAARAFSEHHKVDPIPVVNENRRVVGIISRYDMVKMFRGYGMSFASDYKNKQSSSDNERSFLWLYIIILALVGAVAYFLFG